MSSVPSLLYRPQPYQIVEKVRLVQQSEDICARKQEHRRQPSNPFHPALLYELSQSVEDSADKHRSWGDPSIIPKPKESEIPLFLELLTDFNVKCKQLSDSLTDQPVQQQDRSHPLRSEQPNFPVKLDNALKSCKANLLKKLLDDFKG